MTARGDGSDSVRALGEAWPRELVGELNLVALDAVGSTQDLARRLIERHAQEEEEPAPLALIAISQSAGRGRRGRRWESAAGLGVWASLALPAARADLATIPMRAAVALATRVRTVASVQCRLKWPNDLVVGRKKLGGLLVDAISVPHGDPWAVVGFGLNHGHAADQLPVEGATSLRLAAGDAIPSLPELAVACVSDVWRQLSGDGGDWLDRYRKLSVHRIGDALSFEIGDERVEGRLAGFDEAGVLLLETAAGRRRIHSGEVFSW